MLMSVPKWVPTVSKDADNVKPLMDNRKISSLASSPSVSPDEGDLPFSAAAAKGLVFGTPSMGISPTPLGTLSMAKAVGLVLKAVSTFGLSASFPSIAYGLETDDSRSLRASDRKGAAVSVLPEPAEWIGSLTKHSKAQSCVLFQERKSFREPKKGARWGCGAIERHGVFIAGAFQSPEEAAKFAKAAFCAVSSALNAAGIPSFVGFDGSDPVLAAKGRGGARYMYSERSGKRLFGDRELPFPGKPDGLGGNWREASAFPVGKFNSAKTSSGIFVAEAFIDASSIVEAAIDSPLADRIGILPAFAPVDCSVSPDVGAKGLKGIFKTMESLGLFAAVDDIGAFFGPNAWLPCFSGVLVDKDGLFVARAHDSSEWIEKTFSDPEKIAPWCLKMKKSFMDACKTRAMDNLAEDFNHGNEPQRTSRKPEVRGAQRQLAENPCQIGEKHAGVRGVAKRAVKLGPS